MSATAGVTVLLENDTSEANKREVLRAARAAHPNAMLTQGDRWSAICLDQGAPQDLVEHLERLPGVLRLSHITAPYRLASKQLFDSARAMTLCADPELVIGGGAPVVLSVIADSDPRGEHFPEHAVELARAAGARILQIGSEALGGTRDVQKTRRNLERTTSLAHAEGIAVSVEVADMRHIDVASSADMLQVGSRSMQNFTLLRELGRCEVPVMLCRGLGATIEEFLLAAEYVLANGNGRVLLCEAGTAVPGSGGRPRFEINAVPLLKLLTHLPVLADPSVAVPPTSAPAVARAAVAAGADGIVLRVGDHDTNARNDGAVSSSEGLEVLEGLAPIAAVVDRTIARPPGGRPRASGGVRAPNLITPRIRDAQSVLRQTDRTLAAVINDALGVKPRLDVLSQRRISPPYPQWLWWALRPEGDLLVRWTGYRLGRVVLTRNLAYVDLGRVDPDVIRELESEELNLGQLFTRQEIDRFGFEFGTGSDAGEIDIEMRAGHTDSASIHPYVWRRYIAATSGRIGFLVIESLPVITWRRLLDSSSATASHSEDR